MGIDRDFAEFLLCAKDGGVDFGRVATLGRLKLFVDHRSLHELLRAHGFEVTDQDIRDIRAADDGYAEAFLRKFGAQVTASVDASAYEHCSVVHDMNRPIADALKRQYSVVIDGGTLEHIFDFPTAIRNCMEMLTVGGHFFAHTMANNFMGHGFYQFSPELFYRVFSPENGFRIHRVVAFESRIGKSRWYQAADPQQIGERVELVNGRQTYLMVHAERVADVPIFAVAPQQADYSALWSRNAAVAYGPQGVRGAIYRWAKPYSAALLQLMPGFVYDFLLSVLVRAAPRRGFRRGHYSELRTLKG